jgi:hypothetical protein
LRYGPNTTGCPAVEQAIQKLYEGQSEENFWSLMNALNYALEMETEVLVPVDAVQGASGGAAPWAANPIPESKTDDIRYWTLHNDRHDKVWLPVFTKSGAAMNDRSTATRPMAQKKLRSMMELVLSSEGIDGMVIDPWNRSASLERALLRGLLHEAEPEPQSDGERYVSEGLNAGRERDWKKCAECYRLAAQLDHPAGQRLLGLCYRHGAGVRQSSRMALRWLNAAAAQGDIQAMVVLGDMYASGEYGGAPNPGLALLCYRRARTAAAQQPDIEYWPELCLRLAQYEVRYASREEALLLAIEARHGLELRMAEGDMFVQKDLEEAEALCKELSTKSKEEQTAKSAYSTERSQLD